MLFGNNSDEAMLKKIIKKEECHKLGIISFYELFLMSKERYNIIEDKLSFLRKILSQYFKIINITFKTVSEDEAALIIEFYDEKKEYMIITTDYQSQINIALDTTMGKYNNLIYANTNIIMESFKIDDSLAVSSYFNLQSATKLFNINGSSDELSLTLNSKDTANLFKLISHFDLNKVDINNLLDFYECHTNFDSVKSELENLEILRGFLDNIKINKEDIPKVLCKK